MESKSFKTSCHENHRSKLKVGVMTSSSSVVYGLWKRNKTSKWKTRQAEKGRGDKGIRDGQTTDGEKDKTGGK